MKRAEKIELVSRGCSEKTEEIGKASNLFKFVSLSVPSTKKQQDEAKRVINTVHRAGVREDHYFLEPFLARCPRCSFILKPSPTSPVGYPTYTSTSPVNQTK